MTTLTEFKEIEAKATKGPWEVEPVSGYCVDYILTKHPDFQPTDNYNRWKNFVAETTLAAGHPKQNFHNDSKFIAISRSALPALIAVAEKLEDTLWQCLDDLSGGSMEFPGHGICEAAWNNAKQALAAYEAWGKQIEGGDDV